VHDAARSRDLREHDSVPVAVRPPRALAAPANRGANTWYLRRAPGLIATIAALLGLLSVLDAVWVAERRHLGMVTRVLPVPASATATAISAVSGLLLLRLAAALRKRKRRAWRAAVALTVVILVARQVRADSADLVGVVICAALLVLLITARSRFTAKGDPHSRWFAVRVGLQMLSIAIVYGMVVLYTYSDHVAGNPSFWQRLTEVLSSLVGGGGWITLRTEALDDVLHGTLLAFGLTTIAVVGLLALRPYEPIAKLSDDDEQRLRGLLERHGTRDSLGYFALRRDKSVVWSPSGKAAITYRVVFGVALASGDPIGDPEAWPGAIAAYRDLVEEYAWTPAVIGNSELGATVFKREMGLTALALGDEAIVDVTEFSLDGRPMRGVRQACTKVTRAGYDVRIRRVRDIDPDELAVLANLAQRWRGDAVERGFSMALSRFGDPDDGAAVVATAHRDGRVHGFLHFVPWGAHGLSLDVMRRDHAADNGLNEFLIAEVLRRAPELDVQRVSLNFAVFRDALERGERIGAGPVLRAWRAVLLLASRWWQIESLYRFNAKFRPCWEPRFVSFPSSRDIPRIAVAALEAEAFIVRPHRLKRVLHRA
jgi:lysyl-tRNA synthetase class 2